MLSKEEKLERRRERYKKNNTPNLSQSENKIKTICENCGVEFYGRNSKNPFFKQRFCTQLCRIKYSRRNAYHSRIIYKNKKTQDLNTIMI